MGQIYLTLAQPIGAPHPRHPTAVKLRSRRIRHFRSSYPHTQHHPKPSPVGSTCPHDGLDALTAQTWNIEAASNRRLLRTIFVPPRTSQTAITYRHAA